jgi:hypothetical protein
MGVERAAGGNSFTDVLDRVLDKGIVMDPWVRVSLVAIDLMTAGTRVVVDSYEQLLAENLALRAELSGEPRKP